MSANLSSMFRKLQEQKMGSSPSMTAQTPQVSSLPVGPQMPGPVPQSNIPNVPQPSTGDIPPWQKVMSAMVPAIAGGLGGQGALQTATAGRNAAMQRIQRQKTTARKEKFEEKKFATDTSLRKENLALKEREVEDKENRTGILKMKATRHSRLDKNVVEFMNLNKLDPETMTHDQQRKFSKFLRRSASQYGLNEKESKEYAKSWITVNTGESAFFAKIDTIKDTVSFWAVEKKEDGETELKLVTSGKFNAKYLKKMVGDHSQYAAMKPIMERQIKRAYDKQTTSAEGQVEVSNETKMMEGVMKGVEDMQAQAILDSDAKWLQKRINAMYQKGLPTYKEAQRFISLQKKEIHKIKQAAYKRKAEEGIGMEVSEEKANELLVEDERLIRNIGQLIDWHEKNFIPGTDYNIPTQKFTPPFSVTPSIKSRPSGLNPGEFIYDKNYNPTGMGTTTPEPVAAPVSNIPPATSTTTVKMGNIFSEDVAKSPKKMVDSLVKKGYSLDKANSMMDEMLELMTAQPELYPNGNAAIKALIEKNTKAKVQPRRMAPPPTTPPANALQQLPPQGMVGNPQIPRPPISQIGRSSRWEDVADISR